MEDNDANKRVEVFETQVIVYKKKGVAKSKREVFWPLSSTFSCNRKPPHDERLLNNAGTLKVAGIWTETHQVKTQ